MTEELKNKLIKAGVHEQMASATQADKLAATMEKLSDLFVQLMDPLMPIFDAIINVLKPVMAILAPVAKLLGDIIGLVMKVVKPFMDFMSGNMAEFADIFTGIFTLDGEKIMGAVSGIMGNVGQLVTDVIVSPFKSIGGFFSGLFGDEPETPDVPQLASGGIVTKATMAMIGEGSEPEAIIPLSKLSSMMPSGMDMGNSLMKAVTAPMRAIGSLIPSEGIQSSISSFEEDPMGSIGNIFSSAKEGISNIFGGNDEKSNNDEVVVLLKELIVAVKEGGDVFIDGAKAGKSLALATSKMG